MKGIVLDRTLPGQIDFREIPENQLQADQVKIRIKAAALNHRDEWCRQGLYPNISDGVILGSDGAGVVEAVGSQVTNWKVGDEVIINPALFWGNDQRVQSRDFQIIGMPSHGTLADFIIVSSDRIFPKPSHLSWEEAASLPLAGLTAYRALVYQGKIQASDRVLITGFGGGVAQFAAQFAIQKGASVYVSSSSSEKIQKAEALGAIKGFNYKEANWVEKALEEMGGFDLIIDGASGDQLNQLIKVARPGGRIVIYGATLGNPKTMEARRIFWNQLKIIGSTMGSDEDFKSMLDFVNQQKIHPLVDQVFPFERAKEAFDRMRAGDQMGKIVLIP
ncbi:MAG: zinc-binding dehydrogenase [Algoriphagus sp.]|uniref:zinc-binding dehydrogenase n=1 Tax=Algoriphagus sp. TaxID=1872435 RepID=UPI0017EAA43C|nr:zinc-binding dehydrogenase [Algoriphagus sp.]NVJ85523.1 zinc-binding dehydrogenase [Algoriphagus sp.]